MKLIGFVFYRMSPNDKKLFMIDELKSSNIEFVLYDLSYLVNKEYVNKEYADYCVKSYSELNNILSEHKNFLLYFDACYKLKYIFNILYQYENKNFIKIANGILGMSNSKNRILERIKKLFNNTTRKDFFYNKLHNTNIFNIRFEAGKSSHGIEIPSFVYDNYFMRKKKKLKIEKKYHVFLDQNLPYHRDLKEILGKSFKGTKSYYKKLRTFFDYVENITGKEVKIALHPRSEHKFNDFGHREILEGQTCEMVSNADMVFAHFSTAIHYPILFGKSIILITTNEINQLGLVSRIENFSDLLSVPILEIENLEKIRLEYAVNKNKYQEYIYKYIVSKQCIKKQKLGSEIVTEELEKLLIMDEL